MPAKEKKFRLSERIVDLVSHVSLGGINLQKYIRNNVLRGCDFHNVLRIACGGLNGPLAKDQAQLNALHM